MKVNSAGKIVETTEQELFRFWLAHWSDLYSFPQYKRLMKRKGVRLSVDKRNSGERNSR